MTDRPGGNVLVGITGAIHCQQIAEYLLRFKTEFASATKVIMTAAAAQMLNPRTVELYVDDRVFIDAWDNSPTVRAPHIQLPAWADLFVVVPATADIMGKAANGIADDLLSTAILASPRSIVFAPGMNPVMWASPALRRNVTRLRDDGHIVIEPGRGTSVTTGRWDTGLGPSPDRVLRELWHLRMTRLRGPYWDEATRELARSPSKWRSVEFATATPAPTPQSLPAQPQSS